jgi:hypothetical protein
MANKKQEHELGELRSVYRTAAHRGVGAEEVRVQGQIEKRLRARVVRPTKVHRAKRRDALSLRHIAVAIAVVAVTVAMAFAGGILRSSPCS